MPDQFVTQKGLPTERQILEQLRQQGIHNLDDLAREAVRHVQTETAGRMQAAPREAWLVYNEGKYGLIGPS